MPVSTDGAAARSSPDSNSGTTSRTGPPPSGNANPASSYTAATSAAAVVNEITYRWQAANPNRCWIHPITRIVSSTSSVIGESSPPARSSASARACTAECCRTSSEARWNPNVSACQIRCCSSP